MLLLLTVGAAAFQFGRWGRPVQTSFAVEPYDPAKQQWRITRRSSPVEVWRARALDGSGVMDEFETPAGSFARPGRASEPKRWLVICLDGVPVGAMQRLWDRGHFREFYRAVPVVSVFPSDSETALTAAFHSAPPPGYEHRYFDIARDEIRGGAWVTLTGAHIPYIRALDYDPPGWLKALPYVVPRRSYRADLKGLRDHFRASDRKVFLAHIAVSDALFHMFPEDKVEPLLGEFETLLGDLYLDARGELGVLVFSDHGNTLTPSRAAPLEKLLEQRGWRLRGRVEGSRDVAVPGYGLIGFIALYCQDAAAPALAQDLTALEGADLVLFPDPAGEGVTVLSHDGSRAWLHWSADGSRFWYDAKGGDPLKLEPIFEHLRSATRLAADGSASDGDLFATTAVSPYPDAAARIRDWSTNHVVNRASIFVSLKPGYFYGKGIFQAIVEFTGTHGALDAGSSLGFGMSTQPLPPQVRLADLLPKPFLQDRTEPRPALTSSSRRSCGGSTNPEPAAELRRGR